MHVYNGTDVDGEARRVSFVLTSDGDFVGGAVETTTEAGQAHLHRLPEGLAGDGGAGGPVADARGRS